MWENLFNDATLNMVYFTFQKYIINKIPSHEKYKICRFYIKDSLFSFDLIFLEKCIKEYIFSINKISPFS